MSSFCSDPVERTVESVRDSAGIAIANTEDPMAMRELYLHRHDRIDTWGMVDRAAPWVVDGSLDGHDPTVLHRLAASPRPIERRSAITAPLGRVVRA